MTNVPKTLKPAEVAELLKSGRAVLVDIREPDEFARRRVKGALSRPLGQLDKVPLDRPVVFTCKSGMRTQANCERLAQAVGGEVSILEGGVDGWAAAGLPVEADRQAPIEIMRQVQIAAGALVLTGALLSATVAPSFIWLSAAIGAGLVFAGVTGFCGMARLLAQAPWNRPGRA
jgi:rhodanese-related sulfurtransferase